MHHVDLPEQVVPGLIRVFGEEAVAAALTPSPVEQAFYEALPVRQAPAGGRSMSMPRR